MGYGTRYPHSQKEHIELYNILKFGVNQANIRRSPRLQQVQQQTLRMISGKLKLIIILPFTPLPLQTNEILKALQVISGKLKSC